MADFTITKQRGVYMPVVLETPKAMIIDGAAHDKFSLNPLFLQNLYADNNNYNRVKLIMNKYWAISGGNALAASANPSTTKYDGGQGLARSVWPSQYDPTEYFVLMPGSGNKMYRIAKSDNSLRTSTSVYEPWFNWPDRECGNYIFNELPARIDMVQYNDGSGNNDNYYYDCVNSYSYDKTISSYSGAALSSSYGSVIYQLLSRNASFSIFGFSGPVQASSLNNYNAYCTYGQFMLIAYNNVTKANTTLLTLAGDTYSFNIGPSVPITDSNNTSIKMTYIAQPTITASFFKIRRVWWDENTPLTQKGYEDCVIDYTGTGFSSSQFTGVTGGPRSSLFLRTTIIRDNSNQLFLCITMTDTQGWQTSAGLEPLANYKSWIFRVQADMKTLKPVQIFTHDDRMYDMIPLNESHQKSIWIYPNYLAFVQWNNATSCYEVVNKVAVTAYGVGVDELDRIWVIDGANRVQLMSPFVPSRVTISYALSEYTYTGTDISTYINVSAYDAFSNRIATSVALTIDGGNCTFADGSVKISVTTNDTAELAVPLLIKNSGYFRVLANTEV